LRGQERARADALGVARSELYPFLSAVALSQTSRTEAYLSIRYYRNTFQSFDLAFNLSYTIFDFGGRSGILQFVCLLLWGVFREPTRPAFEHFRSCNRDPSRKDAETCHLQRMGSVKNA
jgi:hypothetical protein